MLCNFLSNSNSAKLPGPKALTSVPLKTSSTRSALHLTFFLMKGKLAVGRLKDSPWRVRRGLGGCRLEWGVCVLRSTQRCFLPAVSAPWQNTTPWLAWRCFSGQEGNHDKGGKIWLDTDSGRWNVTIANTSQFNENRRISGSQQVLQHIESVYVLKCKEKCENYVDRTVVLSTY